MLTSINISKKIKLFKNDLIKECLEQRHVDERGSNFYLKSKYTEKLYKYFINYSKKYLKPFTIKDYNFKLWCYYSDKTFVQTHWHNHKKTSTINSVLYLQVPKNNRGIDFKLNNKVINYFPKNGDFIIFPSHLDHYPYPSLDEPRISLNLELTCHENSKEIF